MTKKNKPKLIPPDPDRCQTESRSFMTLGPGYSRCTRVPAYIAVETKIDPKYGEPGSMSLCAECRVICEKKTPRGIKYIPIEEWKAAQRESAMRRRHNG